MHTATGWGVLGAKKQPISQASYMENEYMHSGWLHLGLPEDVVHLQTSWSNYTGQRMRKLIKSTMYSSVWVRSTENSYA